MDNGNIQFTTDSLHRWEIAGQDNRFDLFLIAQFFKFTVKILLQRLVFMRNQITPHKII